MASIRPAEGQFASERTKVIQKKIGLFFCTLQTRSTYFAGAPQTDLPVSADLRCTFTHPLVACVDADTWCALIRSHSHAMLTALLFLLFFVYFFVVASFRAINSPTTASCNLSSAEGKRWFCERNVVKESFFQKVEYFLLLLFSDVDFLESFRLHQPCFEVSVAQNMEHRRPHSFSPKSNIFSCNALYVPQVACAIE